MGIDYAVAKWTAFAELRAVFVRVRRVGSNATKESTDGGLQYVSQQRVHDIRQCSDRQQAQLSAYCERRCGTMGGKPWYSDRTSVCAHELEALAKLSATQDSVSFLPIARISLAEVSADPLHLEISLSILDLLYAHDICSIARALSSSVYKLMS